MDTRWDSSGHPISTYARKNPFGVWLLFKDVEEMRSVFLVRNQSSPVTWIRKIVAQIGSVILLKNFFMAIKFFNVKHCFVICLLLMISFVTITLYLNVTRSYLDRASHPSVECSGIFTKSYSDESQKPKNSTDSKLRDRLSHFQDINVNLRQHRHNISKCGYNVSKYR